MYFDRRFNEFWEWCTTQHVQYVMRAISEFIPGLHFLSEALTRGMEKPCKRCAIWPRKHRYRYCGGDACNKGGVPISY
jgi:hypothetical protein